ncbi:MAG: imidazole glycerol phosphate synthase subunit HisH [Pirellulales bacterium]|nr:imidazole glycerol phosphate synthase subunit HisH [Pirellulales bacterium]
MPNISVIDYGMGNLRSVEKGFALVGQQVQITRDPEEIASADKLVLPGVGAFRDAIAEVRRLGLDEPIKAHIDADKPFLGICLGLQLLFDVSYEEGEYAGLGVIPGKCVKFEVPAEYKVPHMGWNQLRFNNGTPIFDGLRDQPHVYFVHSYYVVPDDADVIAAEACYPEPFTAAIHRGNLFATQFHPEKSQKNGLRILENFVAL